VAVTARVVRLLLLPMMLLLPPRKMANDSGIGAQGPGRRGPSESEAVPDTNILPYIHMTIQAQIHGNRRIQKGGL